MVSLFLFAFKAGSKLPLPVLKAVYGSLGDAMRGILFVQLKSMTQVTIHGLQDHLFLRPGGVVD